MLNTAPKVDPRNAADIAKKVKAYLQIYAPDWNKQNNDRFGEALIAVFARFSEIIIERLNQLPEKNFLAFLDILGESQLPPQPAKAPLSFTLAEGAAAGILVPEGTQVAAAPAPGEQEPVLFETGHELTVTPTKMTVVAVRNPKDDKFTRVVLDPKQGDGRLGEDFRAFTGDTQCDHILYLGHRALFSSVGTLNLTLDFSVKSGAADGENQVVWECPDGQQWRSIVPQTDSTKGLARSGSVKLTLPTPLIETDVNSVINRWLRCRLIKTLKPGNTGSTIITSIAMSGEFDVPPDCVLRNNEILDLSQDFFPFGERPAFGANFYIASRTVFSQSGVQVSLKAVVTDPAFYINRDNLVSDALSNRTKPQLTWEYWNGLAWQTLIANDASGSSFTKTGLNTITFTTPKDHKPASVNGEDNYWLRVRITSGNYGQESGVAPFALDNTISGTVSGPESAFKGTVTSATSKLGGVIKGTIANDIVTAIITGDISGTINGIVIDNKITASVTASQAGAPPGSTITGNLSGTKGADGNISATFTATLNLYRQASTLVPPCLKALTLSYTLPDGKLKPDNVLSYNDFTYFDYSTSSQDSVHAFSHNNNEANALYLGFGLPDNVKDFPVLPLTVYFSVAVEKYHYLTNNDLPASGLPPQLSWEYWNGSVWAAADISDETDAFARAGLIHWRPAAGISPKNDFGLDRQYWLRARLTGGLYVSPPRIQRVLLNTAIAKQTVTHVNQVLGSSNENQNQRFRANHAPILYGQQLEIEEAEKPALEEFATITQSEGADAIRKSETATVNSRQSYWIRWHEVPDFKGSGSRDRHYVLDRLTGEIRFGDGVNGLIPPRGIGNIRLAFYQSGGGSAGNKPVGAVSQLQAALPYIDKVTNYEAAGGGSDAEPVADMKKRAPRTLRHRNRAVTKDDFEDLALMTSTQVARALCIPLLDVSKNPFDYVDTEDEEKNGAGRIGVIIVPKSSDPNPSPDRELLRQVKDYLVTHAAATADISVAGPLYLSAGIQLEAALTSLEASNSIDMQVRQKLTSFLHPLTGGQQGAGWPFGVIPQTSDIYRLITEIPGIDHLSGLKILIGQTEIDESGQDAVDKILRTKRYLIYSGQHQIKFTGS